MSNINFYWSAIMAEVFVKCGGCYAVISPGSRSAPLASSFALHESIEAIPVLDERSAAFLALGIAKYKKMPVALICTSGTAAANYMPAVIEASESNTPLIVLTADRPPEMRNCQSGQAIDQSKLYGDYVRFFAETALPEADQDCLKHLRQLMYYALQRTITPDGGPVHLNVPFRDPLYPEDDGSVPPEFEDEAFEESFYGALMLLRKRVSPPHALLDMLPECERGLIIVGPNAQWEDPDEFSRTVSYLSADMSWPVMDCGLSPLRSRANNITRLVSRYECLLRNEAFANDMRPDFVLCIGGLPASKQLRSWLKESDPIMVHVGSETLNCDAIHSRSIHCPGFIETLDISDLESEPETEWVSTWESAEGRAMRAIAERMESCPEEFEGAVAWSLSNLLPRAVPFFVASSMPVRDVETFMTSSSTRCLPFSNRGANGIDGTLSTAAGTALASGKHAVALVGDLSFIHDAGALALNRQLRTPLTVIVVNNDGGGIFEALPISAQTDLFEGYFATPQDVNISALASAYGVEYVSLRGYQEIAKYLDDEAPEGMRILEIKTDRKADMQMRREILDFAASQV